MHKLILRYAFQEDTRQELQMSQLRHGPFPRVREIDNLPTELFKYGGNPMTETLHHIEEKISEQEEHQKTGKQAEEG